MVMDRNGMSHKPAGLPQGEAGAFDGKAGPGGADDLEAPGGFNTSVFNPFTASETGLLDKNVQKALRDDIIIKPFRDDSMLRGFLWDMDGRIVGYDGGVGRLSMPRNGAGEAVIEDAATGEWSPIAEIDGDGDVKRLLPFMPRALWVTNYNGPDFERLRRLGESEDDGELGEALVSPNAYIRNAALCNPHLSDETLNGVIANRWLVEGGYTDGNIRILFRHRTLSDETACALFESGIHREADWLDDVAPNATRLTPEQQIYLCPPGIGEGTAPAKRCPKTPPGFFAVAIWPRRPWRPSPY